MYAVAKIAGEQVKLETGNIIKVPKLNKEVGENEIINEILLLSNDDNNIIIGQPNIPNVSINTQILSHNKGEKVIVFKKKRKKNYKKKNGHREEYTELLIQDININ